MIWFGKYLAPCGHEGVQLLKIRVVPPGAAYVACTSHMGDGG